MKNGNKKIFAFVFILFFLLALSVCAYFVLKNSAGKLDGKMASYKVLHVIDGDTFVVKDNGSEKKVRMIGIDAPESAAYDKSENTPEGKAAAEYLKKLIEGKTVKLEFDVGMYDQYDRLLAYVYYNGEMINKVLLKEGYAVTMTIQPNIKYADEFYELQKEAQRSKKGFWKDYFEN